MCALSIKEGDIDIYVLPDEARCSFSNKSPTEMDECPLKIFDAYGMVCRPGECELYHESYDFDDFDYEPEEVERNDP